MDPFDLFAAVLGSVTITIVQTVQQHYLAWIYLDTYDTWLYL